MTHQRVTRIAEPLGKDWPEAGTTERSLAPVLNSSDEFSGSLVLLSTAPLPIVDAKTIDLVAIQQ